MRPVFLLAAALALLPAAGCAGHDHGHGHMERGTPEERIARYEDAQRAAWQRPDEVVRALALPADAVVADLGAGSGYFAVRLARAVPEGRVLALDVEPAFVEHLQDRARRERLPNLEPRRVAPDDPGLAAGSVDVVLIVDVYHHLADRPRYLARLRRALRPGGRIALVDFKKDSKRGPAREHKLDRETVLAEAQAAGLALAKEHAFLEEQYFLELRALN